MKKHCINKGKAFSLILIVILSLNGCGGSGSSDSSNNNDGSNQIPADTYDVDTLGIPRIFSTNYLDLTNIYRISKFRSSEGHDFSDAFESNRSMKHYFHPREGLDWTTIAIYAPLNGTIERIDDEWGDGSGGYQLWIIPSGYSAFRIRIFHVDPESDVVEGASIAEGQLLGYHATNSTWSDVAVSVWAPDPESIYNYFEKYLSVFEMMTEACFAEYSAYGAISTRSDLIITAAQREVYDEAYAAQYGSGSIFNAVPEADGWVEINP